MTSAHKINHKSPKYRAYTFKAETINYLDTSGHKTIHTEYIDLSARLKLLITL